MEPVNYLKVMLGITEGTVIDTAIDYGMGAAPVVGKVYQSYQMWKLQKRMTANELQLLSLKGKVEKSENEVFYKQEVFPLIVKSLMEEDEDSKAKVIIDGFEYVINNELNEIERIYHYYDVLSELRYSDILMFVNKYMPYDMRKNIKLNMNLVNREDMSIEDWEKYEEEKAFEKYQANKLLRLGLIYDEMLTEDEDRNLHLNANKVFGSRTSLSDFGRRFLEFFILEDNIEE